MSTSVQRGTWLRANRGLALWAVAMAVAVVAFVSAVEPDVTRGTQVLVLAIVGLLVMPIPLPTNKLPKRIGERLAGAFCMVALGMAYVTVRALLETSLPPAQLDAIVGAVIVFLAIITDDAAPRVLRLVGIELSKLFRSRLWQVGLLATVLVTLLAALLRSPIGTDTGWSVAAQTLGTGMWAAELFILVLGATTIAGELGQGTLKMILPHAYRRSEWIAAKGLVLIITAAIFTAVVALVAVLHAQATHGLGDVVKEVPAGFGDEEGGVEVFQSAGVMSAHLWDATLSGLAVLAATALIGVLFSCIFDSVVPALSTAFLFFLGLKSADVLLGLSQATLRDVYASYPATLREWTMKFGRGLNETWDPAYLEAGLILAALTGALAWLLSVGWLARRDLHG